MSENSNINTVKDIIKDYLIRNKYDGLACTKMDCGCSVDELEICDYSMKECAPAYRCKDTDCTSTFKCFLINPKERPCDEAN